MKCPHCAYLLDPFDLVCPRCHQKPVKASQPSSELQKSRDADWEQERIELRQKALERQQKAKAEEPKAEAAPFEWDWSGGIPQGGVGQFPSSLPSSSAITPVPQSHPSSLPPAIPPQSTPTPSYSSPSGGLLCPCCQGSDIQSVSAIVRGGTWSSSSRWSTSGSIEADTTGINMGRINGQHSHADTFGVNLGHTSGRTSSRGHQSSSGATELARTLAPPTCAPTPVKKGISENAGCWFIGIPLVFFTMWKGGAWSGWICWPVILLTLFIWWATWNGNKDDYQKELEKFENSKKVFESKLARWNALYYCHRCDIVFNPATGRYTHATNMNSMVS